MNESGHKLRSLASLLVLPLILVALLVVLGRNLDLILDHTPPASTAAATATRHVNARSASFGSERALADAEAAQQESDAD